jgi:hypothetical protein
LNISFLISLIENVTIRQVGYKKAANIGEQYVQFNS